MKEPKAKIIAPAMSDRPADQRAAEQPVTHVNLLENLLAPEIYVDEITSIAALPGHLKLTLGSLRWDYSNHLAPEQRRVVVARLVLPVSGAQSLAVALIDFLRKHGVSVATAEDKKHMQ